MNRFHMWRRALSGIKRKRSPLLLSGRCASSTPSPTAPELTQPIRGALNRPWERVLEGGKDYGPFMASVLTCLVIFGGTVRTVSG